jgi:hypothetical protein
MSDRKKLTDLKKKMANLIFKDEVALRAEKNKLFTFCLTIISSAVFELFITLCIIGNTACLAYDHYGITDREQKLVEYINIAFTGVFLVEMIFKMLGLGLKEYVRDRFNVFDAIIVFISLGDTVLTQLFISSGNSSLSGVMTALRGFRLLRVFKLAKSWK